MNDSLIKQDESQLRLFGSDQMDTSFFSEDESRESPEFTGARLFSTRPDTYRSIISLSAEGIGVLRIARILHVSPSTVLAVRSREPEKLEIEKNRVATLSREAARMCVEAILDALADPEQIKDLSIKDLGIVHGILVEKSELLSGSPTSRIQVGPSSDVDFVQYMSQIRDEYTRRRMGLGEGKEGTKSSGDGESRESLPGADGLTDGVPATGQRRPVALLEAPKRAVGITTHRGDAMPVNIDPDAQGVVDQGSIILDDSVTH